MARVRHANRHERGFGGSQVREMAEHIEAQSATAATAVEAFPAGPHDVIGKSVHAIQMSNRFQERPFFASNIDPHLGVRM